MYNKTVNKNFSLGDENMKKILILLGALTVLSTTALGNKTGVGLGVGVANSLYKGIDSKAYPIPLFDIEYGNFYVAGTDIGYKMWQNDMYTLSFFANPLEGYRVKASDMEEGYKDIEDRDLQFMGGLRLDADTGLMGIKTAVALSGGQHGAKGRLGFYKPYSVTEKFVIVPGIHSIYYSKDFTDYYFGVDSKELGSNRKDNYKLTSTYSPDSAYSVGINIVGEYRFRDNLAMSFFVGAEKFSKEIGDSPLVDEDYIIMGGTGIKYYF